MFCVCLYGFSVPLVGAFIAGTSLGRLSFRNRKDLHRGSESLTAIFASVFFVSLGILADIRALDMHIVFFLATIIALIGLELSPR